MDNQAVKLLKAFGLIKLAHEVIYLGLHGESHVFCHVDGYVIRVDAEKNRFEVLGA